MMVMVAVMVVFIFKVAYSLQSRVLTECRV